MAKTDALARVTADLARGHTQPAIQRLSSLVAANPTDLDLRRRLAAVHRQVGNRIQAGRWGYLEPDADPAETAAFERAYPAPAARLAALRWPRRPALAATDHARRRLEGLAASVSATRPRRGIPLGVAALLLATVVTLGLAVLGGVTVIEWLTK